MSAFGVRAEGPFPALVLKDAGGTPHLLSEAWRGGVLVLQDDAQTVARLVSGLGLDLPVRLEADPYPLAQALDLAVVPALVLAGPGGAIERVSVGFRRTDLEAFAERLGVPGPLFAAEDQAPAFRPG